MSTNKTCESYLSIKFLLNLKINKETFKTKKKKLTYHVTNQPNKIKKYKNYKQSNKFELRAR